MIPRSGARFSDKIMLEKQGRKKPDYRTGHVFFGAGQIADRRTAGKRCAGGSVIARARLGFRVFHVLTEA
jgi:hypothetical protein